ncbi:DUF456 domain-containing protein [Thalassobacillus sp. CUG 92003]|uniref:DUF456 domain-containing protein n=1 Tax=Thalassobacillus sp. CUG 92003 TaxID=2736641 RepID=UPI0015E635F6|nr:DUF456 domain-containing protein [Thalassobacillus sp. CUG 92003]
MDIILWLIIAACFVLSFASLIFPIIPGPLVLWIGFLIYYFFMNHAELSIIFWIAMILLTIILIVSDIIANSYFVKRYGGSKWGERSAAVGVIVGSFIAPPFGLIIVPFLAVLATELLQKRTVQESFRASIGSLLGFLGGSVAKFVLQAIMIIWFFLEI